MRKILARLIWKVHDVLIAVIDEPLNRLGCRVAFGKNWRTAHDPD